MISSLDNSFIDSIIQKYGDNLHKINLSNNGTSVAQVLLNKAVEEIVMD